MDTNQSKKIIELLERNNELLEAVATMMVQESEANKELVDRLLNKPKKDPFAAFNNQRMVQVAREANEQSLAQIAQVESAMDEVEKKIEERAEERALRKVGP